MYAKVKKWWIWGSLVCLVMMQYRELCLDSEQDISAFSIYLDVSVHAHTPVGSSGMFMSLRETKHIPSWIVQENVKVLQSWNAPLNFAWQQPLSTSSEGQNSVGWKIGPHLAHHRRSQSPRSLSNLQRWPRATHLHTKTCWYSDIIRQVSALLLLTIRNGLIHYHNCCFLNQGDKKSEQQKYLLYVQPPFKEKVI